MLRVLPNGCNFNITPQEVYWKSTKLYISQDKLALTIIAKDSFTISFVYLKLFKTWVIKHRQNTFTLLRLLIVSCLVADIMDVLWIYLQTFA